MRIILVRHGESEANVACIINDNPARIVNLTARGREQAAAAAKTLRAERFTRAYASEFPRARQTAEILLRHHACTLHTDARLNERHTGADGQPVSVFNDAVRPDPLRIRPAGGESFLEQMGRLKSFLDEIAGLRPGGNMLAVSHENPILAALALCSDDPGKTACGRIANCEWVELHWPPAKARG